MQMYTFVWFSVAILETVEKTTVILSHLYVIGLKIALRVGYDLKSKRCIGIEERQLMVY